MTTTFPAPRDCRRAWSDRGPPPAGSPAAPSTSGGPTRREAPPSGDRPPPYCEGRIGGVHWGWLVPWHFPQPSSLLASGICRSLWRLQAPMHYAFDAEFMAQAAFEDELPELLPDLLPLSPLGASGAEDFTRCPRVAGDSPGRRHLLPAAHPTRANSDADVPFHAAATPVAG